MLMQFGFRTKMYYLCPSEEERARTRGFLLFFCQKIRVFYLGDRKFYLRDKNFFGPGTIFFGLGRCAQQLFRKFFELQILKDIKVFRPKKVAF